MIHSLKMFHRKGMNCCLLSRIKKLLSRRKVRSNCILDEKLRVRGKRQRLKVSFADGTIVCDVSATITMMQVIDKIGVERVAALGMEVCHVPLVSRDVAPRYAEWTKEIKPGCGWYLMAQSDTKQKYIQVSKQQYWKNIMRKRFLEMI